MSNFIPRPYRLKNKIQHYDWGTRDADAFIPKLLGTEIRPGVPYAELWIGAHPKAPSEIEVGGEPIPLNEMVAEYPSECLGEYVRRKFSGTFPFLLKVLSAERALSIQAHPNKDQAVMLHASDPVNYPDENHKPEVAVALDSLVALTGFRPAEEIVAALKTLPELEGYAEPALLDRALGEQGEAGQERAVGDLYADIMRRAGNKMKLEECVRKIRDKLAGKKLRAPEEEQFLEQYEAFGPDVGLLSFFFFNMVRLGPGEGLFTDAGVPHAYLRGNIVECMANSDNVVRAGLTSKYKDVGTLLKIMKYDFRRCPVLNASRRSDEVVYGTAAEEFRITRFHKMAGSTRAFVSGGKPSISLIINGEIEVSWGSLPIRLTETFSKGETFFSPAFLEGYSIKCLTESDYFVVDIP